MEQCGAWISTWTGSSSVLAASSFPDVAAFSASPGRRAPESPRWPGSWCGASTGRPCSCPWTVSISPTGSCAGSVAPNARVRPTPSTLPDMPRCLARLRSPDPGTVVYAPDFDRSLEEALAGSIPVAPQVPLVVTEGNYLLHDEGAWAQVRDLVDEIWYLNVDERGAGAQTGRAACAAREAPAVRRAVGRGVRRGQRTSRGGWPRAGGSCHHPGRSLGRLAALATVRGEGSRRGDIPTRAQAGRERRSDGTPSSASSRTTRAPASVPWSGRRSPSWAWRSRSTRTR